MSHLTVGLSSGLGNCVYMLPAIKALRLLGHDISLYVQGDFDMADLWKRCTYASEVVGTGANVNGSQLLAGQYRPPDWRALKVKQYRLPAIHACEWKSNFRLASDLGWKGGYPDVSDWCAKLDKSPFGFDVGIVPGCKGGIWLRKRYPGMKQVAEHFLNQGKSVAVFGLQDDGVDEIPGEKISGSLAMLPDYLAGCRVIVSTDSGVGHLASSLGVPVVMVYTATSKIKAEPVCKNHTQVSGESICQPCVSTGKWHVCSNWKCRNIDPQIVIDAANKYL